MQILTLEQWLELFGDDYPCEKESLSESRKVISPDRLTCLCKNCKQARQDYQFAITADKKRIEEFEQTKPKEQAS